MSGANRTLLEAIVRMFATGDVSEAEALFAANYVDHQGLGGTEITGPSGLRRVVQAARSSFTELDVRIVDVLSDGDEVAARLRWHGTSARGVVDRETIDILRFENGKAVEHWGARLWISDPR